MLLGCNLNFHKRCVVKLHNDCGNTKHKYKNKTNSSNLNVSLHSPSNIAEESVCLTFIFEYDFNMLIYI